MTRPSSAPPAPPIPAQFAAPQSMEVFGAHVWWPMATGAIAVPRHMKIIEIRCAIGGLPLAPPSVRLALLADTQRNAAPQVRHALSPAIHIELHRGHFIACSLRQR